MTDHTAPDLVGELTHEIYTTVHRSQDPYNPLLEDRCRAIASRLAARFGIFSKPEKNPYLVGEIEEILDSQCRVVKVDGWNEINCIDDQRTWEVAKVLAARFGQRTDSPRGSHSADAPQAEDRWIPVSERLPEPISASFPGCGKLVWDGWDCSVAELYEDGKWHFETGVEWDLLGEPLDNVTHWMPLPAPPKEEK